MQLTDMTEQSTEKTGMARRVPVQKRSRERYELILKTATDILSEKGSDAFKMSDIVDRTKISFGSLYQYFPDKTAIIGTLADGYNQLGHECIKTELATIKTADDVHPSLCRLVDSYYQVFTDLPVMADILNATQSDKVLQKLDAEDMNVLSGFLMDALLRFSENKDRDELKLSSLLIIKLITSVVRFAITLEPLDAEKTLLIFKGILPMDVKSLVGNL